MLNLCNRNMRLHSTYHHFPHQLVAVPPATARAAVRRGGPAVLSCRALLEASSHKLSGRSLALELNFDSAWWGLYTCSIVYNIRSTMYMYVHVYTGSGHRERLFQVSEYTGSHVSH